MYSTVMRLENLIVKVVLRHQLGLDHMYPSSQKRHERNQFVKSVDRLIDFTELIILLLTLLIDFSKAGSVHWLDEVISSSSP